MKKTELKFNKPVYLGLCILDLIKTLMYDFHYNYIKQKYGDKAKHLFTDTDSLMYEIETEDFYKDISEDVCYVHTQLFLALYMCVFIFVSPVAIFRTGFSFVEYCSGSFQSFLQSDY